MATIQCNTTAKHLQAMPDSYLKEPIYAELLGEMTLLAFLLQSLASLHVFQSTLLSGAGCGTVDG